MATNDKFRHVIRMTYLGQECQNVFHWLQTAGTGGANALNNEFITTMEGTIRACQNVGVSHVGSNIVNLDDTEDFLDVTFGTPRAGTVSGEGLPSYACWTFKINRTSRSFRNGSKRFVGISESSALGNTVAAAFLATVQACATALSATLDDGTNTWELIIARYTGTPPSISSWDVAQSVVYSHIGSQVSRKAGVGS